MCWGIHRPRPGQTLRPRPPVSALATSMWCGLGTMLFAVGRLMSPRRRPVTLGTWLFHCRELDLHLAGTVDQTGGQAIPFRVMAGCLNAWRS